MLDPRAAIDRELIKRGGLVEFIKRAWHIVETVPYVHGWHIEEIAKHCQAVTEGRLKNLVVNVPPGHSKSLVMSVLWPAWSWIERPWLRWICASFDYDLALRDSERMYNLVSSQWYIARFGQLFPQDKGRFAMADYSNVKGGFRFSTSVGAKGTGRHGHVRLVDDPLKPSEAALDGAALELTNNWWSNTMATRRADPDNFASVVVMQRLHERDLSQTCIEAGYTHLCLPMHFDPSATWIKTVDDKNKSLGGDRRTKKNELLNPNRFSATAVLELERALGDSSAGQLEQRPAPPGGMLFKKDMFLRFTLAQMKHSDCFSVLSIDCSFKDGPTSDFVAAELWGTKRAKFYLFDSVLERLDFEGTLHLLAHLNQKYRPNAIIIEDKANGPAVISIAKKKLPNIIAVNPRTSKPERAQAANVYYQAGSVFHLEGATWLVRKEANLSNFPRARNDDDVDATSQALLYLSESSGASFAEAMAKASADLQMYNSFIL